MDTMELAAALERYLGCPCQFFPSMKDDDPVMNAYHAAQARGKQEGFLPMLLVPSENLAEAIFCNIDRKWKGGDLDPDRISAYREELLHYPLYEGDASARELIARRREEAADWGLTWGEIGEISGGDALTRFLGYWNYSSRMTEPILLAEIPVTDPWRVFAYLPFGGWNECPDEVRLMEMSKSWFERYGAVPAVMTSDVLEFTLPAPISKEDAPGVALEQYAFCSDIVDQGVGTIGALADGLSKSTCWYFWWD